MLTTTHLLAGAAIGKITGNAYLAVPVALASHHVLDFIPHYNQKPVKGYLENGFKGAHKIDLFLKSLEPVAGLIAGIMLMLANPAELRLPIFIGGLFGWLPDLFIFLDWKYGFGRNGFMRKLDRRFHRHTPFIKGNVVQAAVIAVAVVALL